MNDYEMTQDGASASSEIAYHFPGDEQELLNAQKHFHSRRAREERFEYQFIKNALCGLYAGIRRRFKDQPVSVLDILNVIKADGYLNNDFLKQDFGLTENDVLRALNQGIVPPTMKQTLSNFFNIKD